eukprot:353924-Chlamydomonas_euryale.AAC.4
MLQVGVCSLGLLRVGGGYLGLLQARDRPLRLLRVQRTRRAVRDVAWGAPACVAPALRLQSRVMSCERRLDPLVHA